LIVTAWRIVKAKYVTQAFDGEGARHSGGRWNSKGSRMVYTSAHASLAILEVLVGLGDSGMLPAYSLASVDFDERLFERLDVASLTPDWRHSPAPPELQRIGDLWLTRKSSAVLAVPSALVDTEENYLINPQHANFASLRINSPKTFEFDSRLVKGS
jgi:RES domain-containing protein